MLVWQPMNHVPGFHLIWYVLLSIEIKTWCCQTPGIIVVSFVMATLAFWTKLSLLVFKAIMEFTT